MPLINARIPNFSSDQVAVFDQNFQQVFPTASTIKLAVTKDKKVMEHPVETGVVITDHVIINPVEIELALILKPSDYRSVYQQIEQLFKASTLLTVQSKAASYQNLLISAMPSDEDADMFDAIAVALRLHQVQYVTAQFGTLPASKVKNKSNASTIGKGGVQTKDATQNSSAVYDWLLK